jgi:hypothetical protein
LKGIRGKREDSGGEEGIEGAVVEEEARVGECWYVS